MRAARRYHENQFKPACGFTASVGSFWHCSLGYISSAGRWRGRGFTVQVRDLRNETVMLKTAFEGETFPHRLMWKIAEDQAKLASERERDWSEPALVAMTFAFHTVEAYMNFLGSRLAPEIWEDEENSFRKEPYRGWKGKLRKVMELVGLPWLEAERPLKTILELKELRDRIAHGKPEKLAREILHPQDTEAPLLASELRSMFTPKEKLTGAMHDVKQFVEQIHTLAAPNIKDEWFGSEALRGPQSYSSRATTISREGVT